MNVKPWVVAAALALPGVAVGQDAFDYEITNLRKPDAANTKLTWVFDNQEYDKCDTRTRKLCRQMHEQFVYRRYDLDRRGGTIRSALMTGRQIRYTGLGSISRFSMTVETSFGYPYVSLTKRGQRDVLCATWVNAGICSGLRASTNYTLHFYDKNWRDNPTDYHGRELQQSAWCFRACL